MVDLRGPESLRSRVGGIMKMGEICYPPLTLTQLGSVLGLLLGWIRLLGEGCPNSEITIRN